MTETEIQLKRYQTLMKNALDGVHIIDIQGDIVEANEAFCDMLGYSQEEANKLNIADWDSQWTNEELLEKLKNFAGVSARFETVHRRKDGKLIDVEISATGVEIDGQLYIFASSRNITEQKIMEHSLKLAQYSVDHAQDAIFRLNQNAQILYVNDAACHHLGYAKNELLNLSVLDIDPALSMEIWRKNWEGTANAGWRRFETFQKRKDGTLVPVEVVANYIKFDGEPIFTSFARDITERKAAEAKIIRLTQLYAALSQCNESIVRCTSEEELFPVICRVAVEFGGMQMTWIGMVDPTNNQVNPVASYGYGTEYLNGIQVSMDADDTFGRGPVGTAIRENRPFWCEDYEHDPALAPWRQRGNKTGWKAIAALPLLRSGAPVGILALYSDTTNVFDEDARHLLTGMATDISFALNNFAHEAKRKQAEQKLNESEQRFRGLVEQSLAGIYIIQDGKLVYVNPRTVEILGRSSANELIGQDPLQLTAEADRGKVAESMRQLVEMEYPSVTLEFNVLRKDGDTVSVGANASLATYQDRSAILGMLQDISEKIRDEERIKNYIAQLQTTFLSTVQMATSLSEMRDPYTAGHERRVSEIAVAIATELGLDKQRVEGIKIAGFLHDIGKISIPAEILVKPGRLSATEYALVQGHAQASYEVLKLVEFPWPVATIALQHHERMNGSGYPNGLTGDEILLESRIMAVADVVEAMASHRPYRPGLGIDKALTEIERGSGTLYDPDVADACLRIFREQGYVLPAN